MTPESFLFVAYATVFGGIALYLRRLLARGRDLEAKIQRLKEPEGPSSSGNLS